MNHYPHHIGDFNNATRHLTRLERSVYRDLIEMYYDTEQLLPLDIPAICRKILARSNEEATAVEQVLNEFFTKTSTGWYHDRCEHEIDKYKTSNSQKAEAGRASAAKREAKRQQALNGNPTPVETPLNGTPTNQEPITNNQEPVLKTGANAPAPKFTKPSREDLISEFSGKVGNPPSEAIKFLSYYESNGWKVGRNPMKNWKSAAAGWAARSNDNATSKPNFRPSKSEANEQALRDYIAAIDAEEVAGNDLAGFIEPPVGVCSGG
jgi:uncharacterized protein YdaU (DUF1376 family)